MRKSVVIVGAGFGGLETAKALSKAPVDVLVIDRQNHHCFQPLLYQVATAALSPGDVAWPVRSILSRQTNARVVWAVVTGVDTANSRVITDAGTFPYDFLVLATGATHSYFGHDEWAEYAPGLKRIEDATYIRRRLLTAFEKAELERDAAERARLLTFAIIGGGPTGVELAGAVAELAQALARDFREIDPRAARIVLIEAGPRILPAFPPAQSHYACNALQKLGVEVLTSRMVTSCDASGVLVATGERLEAATLIWAAGVKASPAAEWIGVEADRAGRIKVMPDLTVPGASNIFAIGDTAFVLRDDGHPVPGIAPAAKQMGRHVGRIITSALRGSAARSPFRYGHYGDLATIGRRAAIVSMGRLQLRGFFAWLFWSVAHIYFLIGARNRLSVALDWIWDFFTFQRGARIIEEYEPSQLALTSHTRVSRPVAQRK